jgi:serine/threonine-protein kinase RsbT
MNDNLDVEPIILEFSIEQGDFPRAGEAGSKIKKALLQLGFPGRIIRSAAVSTYEAEMNIVIHSWGGSLKVRILPESIEITAKDRGPGIPDINKAMEEGYSTAPEHIREMGFGAGMGLPNIKHCTDELNIKSVLNQGTTVQMLIKCTKE